MPFKRGDVLKQKVQVIQGPVKRVRIDEDSGSLQYLLEYPGVDGQPTEGWFDEDKVEAVPAEPQEGV